MGLLVRQWRLWRPGTAMLWLAERLRWEKLAEEQAVVDRRCAAGRVDMMRTAVVLGGDRTWCWLVSAVWLCGDVTVSLGT
jgi:hypothetical protein